MPRSTATIEANRAVPTTGAANEADAVLMSSPSEIPANVILSTGYPRDRNSSYTEVCEFICLHVSNTKCSSIPQDVKHYTRVL